MKHFNEIVGTIGVVMFDLLVALFVYLIWVSEPIVWFAVICTICFGATAVYATYKVLKYWIEKLSYLIKNKKE